MSHPEKTVENLLLELQILKKENEELKQLYRLGATERKYAEMNQELDVLRETNKKLEAIVSASPDGMGVVSPDGEIQFISEKLGAMYGFSIDERDGNIGKSLFAFIDPSNHKTVTDNIHKILKGENDNEMTEYLAIKKDKSRFHVEVNSSLLRDSEGRISGILFVARDITERKQVEEDLRVVTEELYEAQEIGNIGSFSYDVACGIFKPSPQFVKIFGFAPGQVVGAKSWIQVVHPDDRQTIESLVVNCLKRGIPYNVDFRIIRDGQLGWLRGISKAEMDAHGKVVRVSGINIDITSRKIAQELLQQTHQNYESFFNTINDFLFVLDEQGNMLHVNSTVINRLGYSWDELSGKSVLMVHPPERRGEAGRIVGEMLQGIAEFCPVPLITRQGPQIPVETRVKQGIWDGKPAIFGVTKDISRVYLSEEKFSKLFHLNPSACGLSDLETNKYLEVNEAFYTLFGFNSNEVIGKTAFDLGIFTIEAANRILQAADSNGAITNAEASLKAKNGELKHVLLSSENIYVQDKKYRFTVVHDITERKQAEEALHKKAAELHELNATKDKFFSIIAHDLKSPFQAIVGFSDLLVEKVRDEDYDGMDEYAGCILQSSKRAMDLLMNLMEWSRSQTGRMDFHPECFDLVEFLGDIIPLFDDIAGQKSISITRDYPPNAMVFADQAMISTVFRNLISNAIKFTQSGGKITLTIRPNHEGVFVSVEDSGIGIPQNMICKLFRIDQSYSTTGTNNEEGTGLGLILCKEFVEKHGGTIWVESEEGKGSTFNFTLPYKSNA
ncbi:MAG: PAS domain S-box protein [Mariniphaga sp.]